MSYILDALKKAEKERKQGTLPDMLTVQDIVAEKSKKRFSGVYFLAAALVLNAGILVWWLGYSHIEKTKVRQTVKAENTSTVSVHQAVQTVAEVPTFPRHFQMSSSETRPAEKNMLTPVGRPSFANPDTKPGLPKEMPDVPDAGSRPAADPPASGSDLPKTAEPMQLEGTGRLSYGQANGLAETPEENRIYKLAELPSSIRQGLPSFSVSALLYSSTPVSRMVRVNDRMMREGQDLAAGVKLEEITRDGLVFNYRNFRFYVESK